MGSICNLCIVKLCFRFAADILKGSFNNEGSIYMTIHGAEKMKKKSELTAGRRLLILLAVFCLGGISGCGGQAQENTQSSIESSSETAAAAEDAYPVYREEDMAQTGTEIPIEEPYLGGGMLRLLDSEDGGQNLSCVMQTVQGAVIVVDGGRSTDRDHLVETIQELGGTVDAWLITHPHNDHVGALTEILNMDPLPVDIEKIYYCFLDRDYYEQGENQGRMADYDNLMAAFENLPEGVLCSPLSQWQEIVVNGALITVMNEPFACEQNTFNNSSVGYRIDMGGKRILFLGDMGWQAGDNLLEVCPREELRADVVQMAHHGQSGVEKNVYEAILPEVCLWPTPQWLWDNELDGVAGAGPYWTQEVRTWMKDLGVKRNLCIKDGDQILR